ncbi:Cytochrome p450 86a2, partial [Globisporangium polare]
MWPLTTFAMSLWQQVNVQHLLLLAAVALAAQYAYEALASSGKDETQQPKLRPKGTLPILYNTLHALKHGQRWIDWLVEQTEIFERKSFWMRIAGNPDMIMLNTPEQFEDVLKTHFECFEKGERMH